ncbi:hypothetical protein M7I_7200 [Glarea lozoyensis 74030]|nr:hypothetical protein M7I_7200 [Glarea lozoyensis 74030]
MSSPHDYDQLETHHLQKALSTYHPSLEALNPQNPEAVVSTSFILYFYMCSVMDFDPFAVIPVEDTSFKYLRGICSVITSGPDVRMKITLFRSLVARPVHFPYWMEETYPVMGPASVLVNFLDDIPAYSHLLRIENSREIYRNRMMSLAPYLVACTKPGLVDEAFEELLVGFKRWQANVPIELDLLVQAFDPMALVLLAHFYAAIGTVMCRMTNTWWWWQEKPGFMVNTIARYLGPEWDVCMAWPKKMAMSFKSKSSLHQAPLVSPLRVGMDFHEVGFGRGFETWVE